MVGPTMWREKEEFWDELRQLEQDSGQPWVRIGDYNDLLEQSEKKGARQVRASNFRGLRHFISTMEFIDLGYSGSKFTWSNKRPGLANIKERIDRGIANVPWRMTFPDAEVQYYQYVPSDHHLIILNSSGNETSVPKSFKFEIFWIREDSCFDVVAKALVVKVDGDADLILLKKIRATRFALRRWN